MTEFAELRIYEAVDAYGKRDDFVVHCVSHALLDWLGDRGLQRWS